MVSPSVETLWDSTRCQDRCHVWNGVWDLSGYVEICAVLSPLASRDYYLQEQRPTCTVAGRSNWRCQIMANNVTLHAADLLDSLNEIVFQTDPQGNWTYLNQAWTRVTGFLVEESLGRNFLEYVHPDERQQTIELFTAVVSGGATYCHHEGRYRTAAGDYCWIELRASVRYDDTGEMVGNSGTMFDITARREAQEILHEQTSILELIAQDAPLHQILGSLARFLAATVAFRPAFCVVPTADRITRAGKWTGA